MSRELIGVYQWQYNGVAPWSEIVMWCRNNLDYCWTNGYETFHFGHGSEYSAFLLRWGS